MISLDLTIVSKIYSYFNCPVHVILKLFCDDFLVVKTKRNKKTTTVVSYLIRELYVL